VLLVLSLLACSDDHGTCAVINSGVLHACIDYGDGVAESDARRSCESSGGAWQDGSCGDTGAAARCDAFGASTTYYDAYLALGVTLDELRATCAQTAGEFTEL
jgi:hypothetical protein